MPVLATKKPKPTTNRFAVLHNGDVMKQPEFHRRYSMCSEDEKYELIGGVVYMASPLRRPHAVYEEQLGFLYGTYWRATPGVESLPDATTILGDDSEPQPDLCLRIVEEYGGRSRENEEEYIVGPPELLSEIAYSTRSIDMNQKREDYKKYGVLEYIVLCIEELEIHWFHFPSGKKIRANRQGIMKSKVFPGLWIDERALLERDSQRLIEILTEGLESREHAAFVRKLEKAKGRSRKS